MARTRANYQPRNHSRFDRVPPAAAASVQSGGRPPLKAKSSSTSGKMKEDTHLEKKRRITVDSFTSLVHVRVGPEKNTFSLHQDLLCNASTFFRAALRGGFKEAADQAIDLPEEDTDNFKRFQLWLYSGELLGTEEKEADITFEVLVDIYIFGEVRGIPHLQNSAITLMISKGDKAETIPIDLIEKIYDATSEKCFLRKLFVDWCAHVGPLSNGILFQGHRRDYFPKDFLIDLVVAIHTIMDSGKPQIESFQPICSKYHIRVAERSTYSCGSKAKEQVSPSLTLLKTLSLVTYQRG